MTMKTASGGRRFRHWLIRGLLALAVIPAGVISVAAIERMSSYSQAAAVERLEGRVEGVAASVRADLKALRAMLVSIAQDSDVRRGVKSILYLEKTDARLDSLVRDAPWVQGVWILDLNRKLVTAKPDALVLESAPPTVVAEAGDFLGRSREGEMHVVPGRAGDLPGYYYLAAVSGLVGRPAGVIAVRVDPEYFQRFYGRDLGADNTLTIDLAGRPELPADTEDGVVKAVRRVSTGDLDSGPVFIHVTMSESVQKIFAPVRDLVVRFSLMAVFLLMLLVAVAAAAGRKLQQPVAALTRQARSYADGDLAAPAVASGYLEFDTISATLAEMARNVGRLIEVEKARSAAEMSALRSQMNPHFLFNILNSIGVTISIDPGRAAGMLTDLAALYRLVLEATREPMIPLGQELEIVRLQLSLEKSRFGDRLEFALDVAADVQNHPIPGLIVQTLVENALKHGIARSREGGRVEVTANRDNGSATVPGLVIVTVRNTGAQLPDPINEGTGLRNTRQRLALLDRAGVQLTLTRAEGWTVARLLI